MNKATRVLSLAILMVAMTGMTGITVDQAFAKNGGSGVGSGGFQLNVKGVDKGDKLPDNAETSGGHKIFVKSSGKSKIYLTEGPFAVLDRDGTDRDGALFQLPKPNTNCTDSGTAEQNFTDACPPEFKADYYVHARVLGPQGNGPVSIVTCVEDNTFGNHTRNNGEPDACSLDGVSLDNANGKNSKKGAKWTDVSRQLLTVCLDTIDDDVLVCDTRSDIFSDTLQEYLWEFDNVGYRNVQLRFVAACN